MSESGVSTRFLKVTSLILCVFLGISIAFMMSMRISYEAEIDNLQDATFHLVNIETVNYGDYVFVKGIVFNSGTVAGEAELLVEIYNKDEVLLESERIVMGNIKGKSYKNFERSIEYDGVVANVSVTVI